MKRFVKFFTLAAILAMILLNGVSFGDSGSIYTENFNNGNSLRDLGFTFFGLHSDGWKLNTADGCLESEPETWSQKTSLYSPGFEAKRNEDAVGLEWTVSFKSPRPDHPNHQKGHHGPFFGKHSRPLHRDWVRVGLVGDKGWLAYSLKLTPEENKEKKVFIHAELEKSGKHLKNAPRQLKISRDDHVRFRIELLPPSTEKFTEIKVYYSINGGGFHTWFTVREKTPFTRFTKVYFDHDIEQFSDLQIKIDDLQVSGNVKDQTPPVTTHDYLYDRQWVKTPITINFTATDQGSGVAQIYYRINEGEAVAGNQIQFIIDGVYTVEYWAVDQDGNSEVPKSLTVKLDQALPLISPSLTPVPNGNGWNNADVTVSFVGTDILSGIVSVTEPVLVTTEGSDQVISGQAVDLAGNIAVISVMVNLDKTAPVISNLQPANGTKLNLKRPVITGGIIDELSGIDPASVRLILDGQLVNGSYDNISKIISYTPGADLASGSHSVTLNASDMAGNPVTAGSSFTIATSDPNLPPDPAEVAPTLDPTIVSDLKTATSFLYTGENPIQTGMDPETIEPVRAAVIRGKVLDKDGEPLPGVKVTVLNHGEYGQTLSRADGVFDLAVNGGGYLTVKYERDGYLSAQRQVDVPWQDYVIASDVILLQPDTKVTEISLTETTQAQVAQGSVVTDEDGIRQATVIFPAGTKVVGLNSDSINVRATEYTVGPNGPKMMPAALPPTTGYTYCVDLTIDEAEDVTFNQPVYFYVENFLNFPVGGIVPVGYYDYNKAAWIPSENGRIIRILSMNDGMAEVDVSGSGQAADVQTLVDLGFTDAERQQLAVTYQVGQSLWRAPINHFSPWDCNWPYGPPEGAEAPQQPQPEGDGQTDDPNTGCGSIIEVENQVLQENIPITGTEFSLNYASNRVIGRKAANMITAKLTGTNTNKFIKRVEVEVNVAGKQYITSYDPKPNLTYNFIWPGQDTYGRWVKGGQIAKVRVGYVYDAVYQQPAEFTRSFSAISGVSITGSPARQEVTLWQEYQTKVRSVSVKNSIN